MHSIESAINIAYKVFIFVVLASKGYAGNRVGAGAAGSEQRGTLLEARA